ncbi:MAG: hypothetical protein IPM57_04670 [Oligoflexia bacterium]|nr:hypothetical protein [Oligoflexia bacterium]
MQKSKVIKLIILVFSIASCGVKTDPIPPVKPVDIGYGKPVYKSEKEKNKIKNKASRSSDEEE